MVLTWWRWKDDSVGFEMTRDDIDRVELSTPD